MSGSDGRLRLVPLGGLGEFGLNSMLLEWGEDAVLIDAGAMFPNPDAFGVDSIAPDFRYLRERRGRLHAILLTHGHDDHIGALGFALEAAAAPVYGSRLTVGLARRRLGERGTGAELRHLEPGRPLEAGPFRVHAIRVAHSVADSLALAIETPAGTVLHSGDFKLDGQAREEERTDVEALAEWGRRGVLALLSDSTNVERRGRTGGEDDVLPAFEEVFAATRGRVLVSCFATALPRIQRVVDLAHRSGRRVAALGRRMVDNIEVAVELGQLRFPPGARIGAAEAAAHPPERLALLVSGSQGEPLSALAGLARGEHGGFRVRRGDTLVLSARVIPGCERDVSRVISAFYRSGCDVVHPGTALVHVSGHGQRDDLAELIRLVRPRCFVPLHGEFRMLAQHARLAAEAGIPADRIGLVEDGEVLALGERGLEQAGEAPAGRLHLDVGRGAPLARSVLRERRALAGEGIVVPVVVVDRATRRLEAAPRIVTRGVVEHETCGALLEEAGHVAAEALDPAGDEAATRERLRSGLRELFRARARRRPLVVPVVVEV